MRSSPLCSAFSHAAVVWDEWDFFIAMLDSGDDDNFAINMMRLR